MARRSCIICPSGAVVEGTKGGCGETKVGRLLDAPHEPAHEIAKAINDRVAGVGACLVFEASWTLLPVFKRGGDNNKLIDALQRDEGRKLVEKLLGLWLGEFDLIVIDEAHKSRGEVDVEGAALGAVEGTVLARLVDALLKQTDSVRRLCLTATPMEMDLSQWLNLLARARSGLERSVGVTSYSDFMRRAGTGLLLRRDRESVSTSCLPRPLGLLRALPRM